MTAAFVINCLENKAKVEALEVVSVNKIVKITKERK